MSREEAENGRDNMEIDGCEPQSPQGNAILDANFLKIYYGKLFPHEDIFKWMSYGNDGKHPGCDQSYFGRREFSFTLENDIYLRYQSFNSLSELEKSINEKCPVKIDIGPVYNVDPAKRNAYAKAGDNGFTPVERELIFDLDINDYNDVRYCCSGNDVCLDCWSLMTAAIKVIDTALRGCNNKEQNNNNDSDGDSTDTMNRNSKSGKFETTEKCTVKEVPIFSLLARENSSRKSFQKQSSDFVETFLEDKDDFGFDHILWVYSGRRGVHCWVCDRKARRLNNEQRAAIAGYLHVYKGNEYGHKKVSLTGPLHPFLARSYNEVLKDIFEERLLCGQELLSSEERFEKILEMIPDESITSELRGKWLESRQSSRLKEDINVVRWGQLKHILQSRKHKGLHRCVEEIVFCYAYPRLDMEGGRDEFV
ncbi:DNA primase POLA3 [Actinidia rufa]|uniref:DNA primase n=1 Tax=Actinidia rufa TaxID=165716 RepID=A0A7J0H063_9ERIC|nr:DNA primase POLA3 [Actinidia rufa]